MSTSLNFRQSPVNYQERQLKLDLKARDEQFQVGLVELGASLERKANLARLEMGPVAAPFDATIGTVNATNVGSGVARDVRFVVVIDSIAPAWISSVEDIDYFELEKSPPALDVTINYEKDELIRGSQKMSGDNSIELTMDELPPGGSCNLYIGVSPSKPMETHEVTRTVTVYGQDLNQWQYTEYLEPYLKKRFQVAGFVASSYCDNCEGGGKDFRFLVSSLKGWELDEIDLQEKEQGSELRGTLYVTYSMPKGSDHEPETFPLRLQAASSDEGHPLLEEAPMPSVEGWFTVVYPGQDGLSLRTGPSISYTEVATLPAGVELAVHSEAVRGEDNAVWWPISSPYGEGWVAEWIQTSQREWRLIKPKIVPNEVVQVVNPLGEGDIDLRDQHCNLIDTLSLATELTPIGVPEPKCDPAGAPIVEEGREWWYVTTPDGTEGWVADFGVDRKAMLIAPEWYIELSELIPPR